MAPPLVARYKASFQLIARLSSFLSVADSAATLMFSLILDTITACLIADMISTLYPPAMSVPSPTGTRACRASRSLNGRAEK